MLMRKCEEKGDVKVALEILEGSSGIEVSD
jgi:hypothetical protein